MYCISMYRIGRCSSASVADKLHQY